MSDIWHCDPGLAPLQEAAARWMILLRTRMDVPPVTFFLQHAPGAVLDDRGHCGGAYAPRQITLRADPDHPAYSQGLGEPLLHTLTHEAHHILRWDGPGYGATLGEALVSEGLATAAVPHLWPDAAEPWEHRGPAPSPALCARAARIWNAPYDHAAWFFGTGDLPNWTRYRLGHWLVTRRGVDPVAEAARPAHAFEPLLSTEAR
ncbi:MAG: DUF2268 domain-containing putative Zn-dependent protease [Pseudomonadota bacterium]